MIENTTTIAELVLERPARARLFERLGLDYCCGGKRTLEQACARRGLDVATVVAVLEAAGGGDAGDERDWAAAPLPELVEHIVSVHHAHLRAELPRLSELLVKVVRRHGADRPELTAVRTAFEELRSELEEHTAEEEASLFPAIVAGDAVASARFEDDHARAGALLERLSELTGGYDPGRALCNSYRATIEGLAELQRDLHRHIHEENNVLFPRAAAA